MRWAKIRGDRRRAIVVVCLLLVAGFVLFEIGVRLLPADSVRYEIHAFGYKFQGSRPVPYDVTKTGTITDRTTIARWRAAVIAEPSGQSLVGTLIAQQRGEITCAGGLAGVTASYVFFWRGLPIESVSQLPTCDSRYMISSGGIPAPGTYLIDPLVQP